MNIIFYGKALGFISKIIILWTIRIFFYEIEMIDSNNGFNYIFFWSFEFPAHIFEELYSKNLGGKFKVQIL